MHLVKIPERRFDILNDLIKNNCMTFEGIEFSDKKALKLLQKKIREIGYEEEPDAWYYCKGDWFSDAFALTDENRYPNDFTFLMIPNFHNSYVRENMGARWLTDIIANNLIKQNAINFNHEPDFDVEED